jgi:L-glyceraldehyde 3-phosphate reductase
MSDYTPDPDRYDGRMPYRRCGRWGLQLPAITLGCWWNFGVPGRAPGNDIRTAEPTDNMRRMIHTAFDCGVTQFDLANNYGPPYGSAEVTVGKIIKDLPPGSRDELIITTKAGYDMWPGPYGEWGTRKYLLASLDQSLKRLGLDYVDIFYSHRFDPDTPLDETLGALDTAVRQGKALYVGISSYSSDQTRDAVRVCHENHFAPLVIHQPNYSMMNRWIEKGLIDTCDELGLGIIAFCPLYQGLLTDKYLKGTPKDSRRARQPGAPLRDDEFSDDVLDVVRKLNDHAHERGQTLAQMALAWVLRDPRVTTALIGASRPEQIVENCKAAANINFSDDELAKLDAILAGLRLPESVWAHE